MPGKRYDKEQIINILKEHAKRLGKNTLSKQEVNQVIPESTVKSYFGSIGKALEACDLESRTSYAHLQSRDQVLSNEDLFNSILNLEAKLGAPPNYNQYQAMGDYSIKPFRSRFGKWEDAIAYYKKWKIENNITEPSTTQSPTPLKMYSIVEANNSKFLPPKSKKTPKLYGEPIDFRGLHHAPMNEQGVVFLFGMVCRELGFRIEIVRTGFPDFEGKYLYDAGKNVWAEARIEMEYKASNFREHGHDADKCDFIVCWENDWKNCPITVIELKTAIMKLPSR